MDPIEHDLQFFQVDVEPRTKKASKSARKRRSQKKAGEADKPGNPGHFHGARAALLDEYFAIMPPKGTPRPTQKAFWTVVNAAYWQRFPWFYELDEEPSVVSRDAPDEEDDAVLQNKGKVIELTQKVSLTSRAIRPSLMSRLSQRIKRHLRYLRQVRIKRKGNPWTPFFKQLEERKDPPPSPRQLSAWQLLMTKRRDEIDTIFEEKWPTAGLPERFRLAYRGGIARDLLAEATPEYRAALEAEAKELHALDLAEAEAEVAAAEATPPEDVRAR